MSIRKHKCFSKLEIKLSNSQIFWVSVSWQKLEKELNLSQNWKYPQCIKKLMRWWQSNMNLKQILQLFFDLFHKVWFKKFKCGNLQ